MPVYKSPPRSKESIEGMNGITFTLGFAPNASDTALLLRPDIHTISSVALLKKIYAKNRAAKKTSQHGSPRASAHSPPARSGSGSGAARRADRAAHNPADYDSEADAADNFSSSSDDDDEERTSKATPGVTKSGKPRRRQTGGAGPGLCMW